MDDNPLKSHCAQYVLPVRLARGRLRFTDLFEDLRERDAEIARLAQRTHVVRDSGELESLFPNFYAGEVALTLADGRTVSERSDIARGYPEAPLTGAEIDAKFTELVGSVADGDRVEHLRRAAQALGDAPRVDTLMALLGEPPDARPAEAA